MVINYRVRWISEAIIARSLKWEKKICGLKLLGINNEFWKKM